MQRKGEVSLRGFQDCERSGGAAEMQQSAAVGRDLLMVAGTEAEEVAQLVVASTEAIG
jgi:hypothetical protein